MNGGDGNCTTLFVPANKDITRVARFVVGVDHLYRCLRLHAPSIHDSQCIQEIETFELTIVILNVCQAKVMQKQRHNHGATCHRRYVHK